MDNWNRQAAWDYHNATKHSYWSIRTHPHFLDWDNKPLPFKIYSRIAPVVRLEPKVASNMPALDAIAGTSLTCGADCVPGPEALGRILHYSAGITRRKQRPDGEISFRAAACTGALYETELYLVCGPLPGLEAGVYHYGAHDDGLRLLRRGDYRPVLVQAGGDEPALATAPVLIVCTGTYWRNAWKYQARAYRHFFWDSGTLLANLLAVATSLNVPARLVLGFVDATVNRLLDLDTQREVTLSMVALGQTAVPLPADPQEITPLAWETVPLSLHEVDYPAMRAMHTASQLSRADDVRAWRGETVKATAPEPSGRLFPLQPHSDAEMPRDPIEQVIIRRGSTRQFARRPISFRQLSTVLDRSTRGIPADCLRPTGVPLNDLYIIAHAVEGLPSGAYFFHRERAALELLKEGDFRQKAGYLGLEQELPADAGVDIFFLADLKPILERFGNRGYRAVQLEAGILGGKFYLASYAQRLGATGLTFYDDEVTDFFLPHAAGKSAIFLMALGVPGRARPFLVSL